MNGNTRRTRFSVRYMAFVGIFGGIAAVLMLLEFPLPFAPPFYKLDFSEVPVLIGGFALGPIAGMLIELIKVLLNLLMNGTATAGVGEAASFVIGCALALPAALVYLKVRTRKGAVIGMAAGTACMVAAGCLINAFILLPAYAAAFHMPMEQLIAMGTAVNPRVNGLLSFALLCVAPFNLVKGLVVSVITALIYKRISGLIRRA